MRILKIILISFFVIFTLVIIAGFVFLKTFDINRYKPQIISIAESTLNRELDFSTIDLNVSLMKGVKVSVRDIVLGEHPAFGTENFLTIEEVYLGVDVLAFVLRKQVSISKALIKNPHVRILRAQDGALNAQSLAAQESPATVKTASPESEDVSQPSMTLPSVFVNSIEIQNGTIVVADQTFEPVLNLAVNNLNLNIDGFSLSEAFAFSVAGSVFGEAENFRVEGRAQIDPSALTVKLSQVRSVTDFKKFSLSVIRALPILSKEIPFPEVLEGSLDILIKDLTAGPKGLESIDVDLQLKEGKVVVKEVAPGISFAASHVNLGVKNFGLNAPFQVDVSVAYLNDAPNISVSGKVSLDPVSQSIRLLDTKVSTDLSAFSFDQLKSSISLLEGVVLPDQLKGKLVINLKEVGLSPQGLSALKMDLALTEAQVAMKEVVPGVSFDIGQVDLALRNFVLNEPFDFSLKAAYFSPVQNVTLKGRGSFDLDTQVVKVLGTDFKTDLSTLMLAQVKESITALKDVPFPDELKGTLEVNLKEAVASAAGLTRLGMDVQLTGGKVVINELAPGVGFATSLANISIKDFSLNDTFRIKGSMAYLSDTPNISFQGNGNFNMETQQFKLDGFELGTELSSFSMEQLTHSIAAVKDVPLPQSLKGRLNVALHSMTAGPTGLVNLNGTTDILNGQIVLKELFVPIDDLNVKTSLSESSITLPQSHFRLGKGKVSLQGHLNNYLTTQNYQMNSKIEAVSVNEIIDQTVFPVKVHGLVSGDLDVSGQGFDPVAMFDALNGKGEFVVTEGKLTDINILKLVLDQLNFVPNLKQTLENSLPPRFKEKIKQKDTIVTAVKISMAIENSEIVLKSFNMEADGFLFEGKGRAGFDQSFNLDGTFIIPQDMALSMVYAVSEFELLYDEQGRIQFPLKASGQGTNIKVMPDVKYITTNAIKNKGRQELQRVFDKVLDKNEPVDDPLIKSSPGTTDSPKQQPPEKVLIEGILDSIFKK